MKGKKLASYTLEQMRVFPAIDELEAKYFSGSSDSLWPKKPATVVAPIAGYQHSKADQ